MVLSPYTPRWSRYFSGTCLLLASLVLLGWHFDVEIFKRPLPGLAAMNPMTALSFLCASLALWFRRSPRMPHRRVVVVMALVCLSIGFWRVLCSAIPSLLSVDTVLYPDVMTQEPGTRMALLSGVNFLILGGLLLPFSVGDNRYVTQGLACWIGLTAWFSILGYMFRLPEFYGGMPFTPMAIQTAACFMLIALSWLNLNPDDGFIRDVSRHGPGGEIGRVLLPAIFLLPLTLGYLWLWMSWQKFISTEFGVALFVSAITFLLAIITWMTIRLVNVRDEQRRQAEEELRRLNRAFREKNDEVNALNEELRASNEELTATNEELTALNDQLHTASETIREQSDIIMKQRDEQLNQVLDTMNVLVWSFDMTGNHRHFISRTVENLLGDSLQNVYGQYERWMEFVVPEDRPIREASLRLLQTQGTSEATYRLQSKGGEVRWFNFHMRIVRDDAGKPLRREGFAMDVTEKRAQDEAIFRYKENLQIIFSNTVEEILLLDSDGRIVMFNAALENFITQSTGRKPEIGMFVWDMTVAERREAALDLFMRVRRGESVTVEAIVHLPGNEVVHELRYSPVFIDGKVKYVTIISIDITEKKKKETDLRRSQAHMMAIINHTNDILTLLDDRYAIVMFNQGNRMAFSSTFKTGDIILQHLPVEHRDQFLLSLQRAAKGELIEYEIEYDAAAGHLWYQITIEAVRTDQHLAGYCVTVHDYTAIKRAGISLRESEERFRALIENSEDVVGLMEPAGRMTYVNPGVERVTGYSPEDFLVMNLESIINPENKNDYDRFFADVRNNPNKLISTSFRSRHKNGNWQWMEGTAINMLEVESVRSIVTNFRDVTSRRQSEQERNNLLSQLIERNNDLLQFSFIASHNLRGPVASILGLLNLMGMEQMPEETRRMLGMVVNSASRLDEVIKDLSAILEMRSHEVHAKEWVSTNDTIQSIRQALQSQIDESGAEIMVNTSAMDSFYTIKSYYYSVLYNLISNAIKYRSSKRRPVIDVSTFRTQSVCGIRIQDNGMGIDLEKYGEKIFTLYQRFHLEVEGKGIGLHMVKTQVNALNGSIDIKSLPGQGALFTIRFPNQLP
ncbi:PAS domain S-box protein [Chryseolinea lacunae]|uniref:histidine kinase n=1 Tax=Chryseolinea lacunae TaxID=2801331 RepID=A0ABS1KM64_9BACT|nr:PAS domain S-box protein [Chryseolinea lacunae]MBL0740327.1 PAS domain S-box protein [Chryseolinea lacunae]